MLPSRRHSPKAFCRIFVFLPAHRVRKTAKCRKGTLSGIFFDFQMLFCLFFPARTFLFHQAAGVLQHFDNIALFARFRLRQFSIRIAQSQRSNACQRIGNSPLAEQLFAFG